MLLVHNIKKLDLVVLLVLFLLSLGFFHKAILGLAVNLVPHLPSLLGPLCPAQARVLRLRSRVLIRKHCNYKNLGLNSTLSVQPEEEGTPGLLRLSWQFPSSFYDTSHGSDPLPDWSQGRGGRYVLKIHFFIESVRKMIQFKIQFKTKSKIFIQKNIHSIEFRIFNRIIHSRKMRKIIQNSKIRPKYGFGALLRPLYR